MRILLDTHALLWWMIGDPRLSARARAAVAAPSAEVFVSAASAWELAVKVRLGKLPEASRLTHRLAESLAEQDFKALPYQPRARPPRWIAARRPSRPVRPRAGRAGAARRSRPRHQRRGLCDLWGQDPLVAAPRDAPLVQCVLQRDSCHAGTCSRHPPCPALDPGNKCRDDRKRDRLTRGCRRRGGSGPARAWRARPSCTRPSPAGSADGTRSPPAG